MAALFGDEEAKLVYSGGEYDVVKSGSYVRCAVTGQKIPLNDLRYWSDTRQEAYAGCLISYERELACRPELRKLLD